MSRWRVPDFHHRTVSPTRRRERTQTGMTNRRSVATNERLMRTGMLPVRPIVALKEDESMERDRFLSASTTADAATLRWTLQSVSAEMDTTDSPMGGGEGKTRVTSHKSFRGPGEEMGSRSRSVRRLEDIVWTRPRHTHSTSGEGERETSGIGERLSAEMSKRVQVEELVRTSGIVPTRYGLTAFPETSHVTQPIESSALHATEKERLSVREQKLEHVAGVSLSHDDWDHRRRVMEARLERRRRNERRVLKSAHDDQVQKEMGSLRKLRGLEKQRGRYQEAITLLELERGGIQVPKEGGDGVIGLPDAQCDSGVRSPTDDRLDIGPVEATS
eukprot:TRINITY_DN80446_c0_g1_i1.p1 TRINITY_DN80446_c0_g1~~TRINITY_DN80446_c0_g1_i1.p1  ORF type:complete len:331 (-),score=79.40 TRINITY_DN80446_c0_g1_i1:88-1080(-)